MFLLISGFEITCGASFKDLSDISSLFEPSKLFIWSAAIGLTALLKILQLRVKHPLFVPLFYILIPIVFYIIVWIAEADLSVLRNDGWLFRFETGSESRAPFWTYWTYFDFTKVSFGAVVACLPTVLALAFFGLFPFNTGVLHVPINCPALSVSTLQEVDMNREILLHGVSNIVSGCFGACQNYLVYVFRFNVSRYTNSVLIYRCGGDSRTSGVLLVSFLSNIQAAAIGAVLVYGDAIIPFIPILVIGTMVFHLAFDLIKEAVYDTLHQGVSRIEYCTILIIMATMTLMGFSEGIIGGLILACCFFGLLILI